MNTAHEKMDTSYKGTREITKTVVKL